jgi:hypothetical protein
MRQNLEVDHIGNARGLAFTPHYISYFWYFWEFYTHDLTSPFLLLNLYLITPSQGHPIFPVKVSGPLIAAAK